jgi:hypothetical protein
MDCEEVKRIIPSYFQHSASEEEIKKVEEHLCVCHDCRTTLGHLMDNLTDTKEEAAKEPPLEPKPQENKPEVSSEEGMIYYPGESVDASKQKPVSETTPEPEPLSLSPEENIKPPKEEPKILSEKPKQEETLPEPELPVAPAQETPEEKTEPVPQGISLPQEESLPQAKPEPAKKEGLVNPEEKDELQSQEHSFALDEHEPIKSGAIGSLEYIALAIGIIILISFIYLITKG